MVMSVTSLPRSTHSRASIEIIRSAPPALSEWITRASRVGERGKGVPVNRLRRRFSPIAAYRRRRLERQFVACRNGSPLGHGRADPKFAPTRAPRLALRVSLAAPGDRRLEPRYPRALRPEPPGWGGCRWRRTRARRR